MLRKLLNKAPSIRQKGKMSKLDKLYALQKEMDEGKIKVEEKSMDLDVLLKEIQEEENAQKKKKLKFEFVKQAKKIAKNEVDKCYTANLTTSKQDNGRLTTKLDVAVFTCVGTFFATIQTALPDDSDTLTKVVVEVYKLLGDAQKEHRDKLLSDSFQMCCACACDFVSMHEKCQAQIQEIVAAHATMSPKEKASLGSWAGHLIRLYATDAAYAAQKISHFVFADIYNEPSITNVIFTEEWTGADSNCVERIILTIQDYESDINGFLEAPMMIAKVNQALAAKCMIYYLEQLLKRALAHRGKEGSCFNDNSLAADRIQQDIDLIQEHFKTFPGVQDDLNSLETIYKIVAVASGASEEDAREPIIALQRRVKRRILTEAVVNDLYHLVGAKECQALKGLESDLKELEDESPDPKEGDYDVVPGLSLNIMLKKHVDSQSS